MKTITIPTNCNPYIVVINNHAYTYRAGDTVEVPDEVAEAIEDAIELEPKPKRYLSKFAQLVGGELTEVTAEDLDGVLTIDVSAFSSRPTLKKVAMANSVIKIEQYAFNWCTKLEGIWLPETPPTLVNANAFDKIKADCIFYCKTQESLEAYRTAGNWSAVIETYPFVVESE
jgi:hypothetical protein